MALAGPEFVTARAAAAPAIEPEAGAVLFPGFGSAEGLLADAVFEKSAPRASPPGAETTGVKVSVLPEAMLAPAVSITVPPDPDCVKLSGLEPDAVMDTSKEPVGRVSVRTTPVAGLGPLLVIVTV